MTVSGGGEERRAAGGVLPFTAWEEQRCDIKVEAAGASADTNYCS